jgi:hypothetical protein
MCFLPFNPRLSPLSTDDSVPGSSLRHFPCLLFLGVATLYGATYTRSTVLHATQTSKK